MRDGTWTYAWEHGRELMRMTGSGKTITFEYNADGLRVSKTVDGVVHNYVYSGGKLVQETYGNTKLDFSYDAYGNPYTFTYSDGTISFVYHYVLNLQGDVIRLVTDDGITVATYAYDAWGNIIDMDYTYKAVADANPLRYRGYYYDSETGLYYLQSRYYNPQWGRFINADAYASTGQGLLGNNMFAYCGNNPVMRQDSEGNFWDIAFDIVSLGASIVEVWVNPADPLAWAGLAGDAIDLIPFVTGVGEVTRAVKTIDKVSDVVETVDDVHDTLNVVDNSSDALTTLYRSVSDAEAEDILTTGRFNLLPGGMESKQFGFDLDETRQFGRWVGQNKIASANIPTNMLNQFYKVGVDTSIFRTGTLTVYGDQLDVLNRAVRGAIRIIP